MWETAKLGDICEILDKQRKPITKRDRISGNYPYYGATGIVDWVADYIFDEKLVLVGEDGAKWESGEKTAFIIQGKTWVNNHAHVLRPIPSSVIHEWLSYYLTSTDLRPWVTGLTVPKLNQAQLCSIPIPLPPLAEQQRIVEKLDATFAEIDKEIQHATAQQAQTSALKTALLSTFLSAEENEETGQQAKLGELCKMYQPKTISKKELKKDGEYAVYGANGIIGRYDKYNHEEPQLLITCRGATCGAVNISQPFSWINGNAMVIQPDEDRVLLRYMEYIFRGNINLKDAITGSAQPQITRQSLNLIEVSYPPLAEQKCIVEQLDKAFAEADKMDTLTSQAIQNYAQLKSAILTRELNPELNRTAQ